MVTIKLNSPYDRGLMIRAIEYYKEKKKEDLKNKVINKDLYNYDINQIVNLEKQINKNYDKNRIAKGIGLL